MKVLPLQGYKSLRALNVFNTLLLGMKMIPAYEGISYEDFFESFRDRDDADKERMIRQAAVFVKLEQDEIEDLICFACDKNGVPYSQTNVKNLNPQELHEIIVAVCMEVGRIRINLVSSAEKKKSDLSQSMSDKPI